MTHMDPQIPTMLADPRVGRILDIVAKDTAVDLAALRLDATIEELGISSLDMTQAVFELESVFDIEIPVISDRPGAEFGTVGDLVGHVLAVLDKAVERSDTAAPPDERR